MRSLGRKRTNCSCRLIKRTPASEALTCCRITILWQSFYRHHAAARTISASVCVDSHFRSDLRDLGEARPGDPGSVVRLPTSPSAVRVSSRVTRRSHGNTAVVSVAKQSSSPALGQSEPYGSANSKADRATVRVGLLSGSRHYFGRPQKSEPDPLQSLASPVYVTALHASGHSCFQAEWRLGAGEQTLASRRGAEVTPLRHRPVAVGGHRGPALAERSVCASSPGPASASSSACHPTAKQAAPWLDLAAAATLASPSLAGLGGVSSEK